MQKILFITPFFPREGGAGNTGGTISNLNMLRTLSQKYVVTVLSFDPNTSQSAHANEPFRVLSHPAPAWRAASLIRNWLKFVRLETGTVCTLLKPDVVIATTSTLAAFDVCPPNIARVALVRAYENFGLSCRWVPTRQRFNLGKLAAVRRFQDRRLMQCAEAVLTNSQFMQHAISERFGIEAARIHVFEQACGIDAAKVAAPQGTIGFVTRGPEKGLSFVLELAQRSPESQFLIYGHEHGRPDLLPSNVDWRGWALDRASMFASAKLWLVPSRWAEPFGRVSIEAQGSDRAVLVASTGGLPETVLDPQFRIDGFDADQWLIRIKSLLQLTPECVESNGAKVRERFSSAVHDARVLDVMEHIFTENRNKFHA